MVPSHLNSGTKSGTIVPKRIVPRYITSLLDVRPRMDGGARVGASASDHEVRCPLRIHPSALT